MEKREDVRESKQTKGGLMFSKDGGQVISDALDVFRKIISKLGEGIELCQTEIEKDAAEIENRQKAISTAKENVARATKIIKNIESLTL